MDGLISTHSARFCCFPPDYLLVELGHFRSPLSVKFLRQYELSVETQRRALLYYQSEEMKFLNISIPLVEIEPTTVALTVARLCHGGLVVNIDHLNIYKI